MTKYKTLLIKPLLLLWPLLLAQLAMAQQNTEKSTVAGGKVEVISLDELSFKKINGKRVRVLVGNVAFKKDEVIFKCDSAIQFIEDETIYAYNNVRFNQGDTFLLTGDELYYDEKNEKLDVRGEKVFMTDGKMKLNTTALFYDMQSEIAYYVDSAFITDGQNQLSSIKGYYYAKSKDMFFKKHVRLINPDYKVKTDTLKYNVANENSYFKGPSYITTKEGQFLYCENGVFYSQGNEVRLGKNSILRDKGQSLKGDSLYFNSNTGLGYAYKRAHLIDTVKHLDVQGNYAFYNRNDDAYMITDSLQMIQYEGEDTLYLTSDTLKIYYDSSKTKRIAQAYYNVRIYNREYQAACDSMTYFQSDSLIDYNGSPVFWMDSFQITGANIKAKLGQDGIEKVMLKGNSLMGQKHPYNQYDQIAGDSMTAYFKNGKVKRVDVHSGARAIYYVLEGDSALVGVNDVTARMAKIRFGKEGIKSLAFIDKGKSLVTPGQNVNPNTLLINGFKWMGDLRPYTADQIFMKLKPIVETPLVQSEIVDETPVDDSESD
ncbi:MAG: OstA-like protein [Bacteroidia bacterium]